MKLCCLGDSLTFGNVGYSYISFMDKSFQISNKGKNGDTVRGAAERLRRELDDPHSEYDAYIIGIGTNDVLLPYLKTVSPFWYLQMSIRCRIKRCIEDDRVFQEEFDRLLDLLSQKNKKAIILGMPLINLRKFPHHILTRRNAKIRELAKRRGYFFIDIAQLQSTHIEKESKEYSWKFSFLLRVFDAILMTILPFTKDWFSKTRGLTMTVDGAHFNSKSAKVVAAEIERTLQELHKDT